MSWAPYGTRKLVNNCSNHAAIYSFGPLVPYTAKKRQLPFRIREVQKKTPLILCPPQIEKKDLRRSYYLFIMQRYTLCFSYLCYAWIFYLVVLSAGTIYQKARSPKCT